MLQSRSLTTSLHSCSSSLCMVRQTTPPPLASHTSSSLRGGQLPPPSGQLPLQLPPPKLPPCRRAPSTCRLCLLPSSVWGCPCWGCHPCLWPERPHCSRQDAPAAAVWSVRLTYPHHHHHQQQQPKQPKQAAAQARAAQRSSPPPAAAPQPGGSTTSSPPSRPPPTPRPPSLI